MTAGARGATMAAMFNTWRNTAMTPWIRRSLFAVFGASLTLGALTACSHRHEHRAWSSDPAAQAEMREKVVERVARRLELNAEQKARLNVLADRLQEQRAALRGSAAHPREEVKNLVATHKFDRAGAQALVAQKTAAVTGKSPEVIAALGDFYDSLDPRQQAQVREFMERGRRGWWQR
jgi:Spy/CpxP family protein refolding chaperone